jgi:hypothetical protein
MARSLLHPAFRATSASASAISHFGPMIHLIINSQNGTYLYLIYFYISLDTIYPPCYFMIGELKAPAPTRAGFFMVIFQALAAPLPRTSASAGFGPMSDNIFY